MPCLSNVTILSVFKHMTQNSLSPILHGEHLREERPKWKPEP